MGKYMPFMWLFLLRNCSECISSLLAPRFGPSGVFLQILMLFCEYVSD